MGLVANGVGYSYDEGTPYAVRAVRGVDLRVDPGELVVIAGTTGSGKSTLLRLLAGLLRPSSGTVKVDGVSPGDPAVRGRVAIVFQNPETQFFAETLLADVEFGPKNLGVPDARQAALDALISVGLDPASFAARSPFTLSGGEARRGAIAGALAMRAPYLLLDEPTAGLDARGRRDVLAAIEAERRGAGVAVVTHDPDEFLGVADRVVALADGEPVFSGTVAALMEAPAAYEGGGLRLPDVVRTQLLARERGLALQQVEVDPQRAARALLDARGAGR